VKKFLPYMGAAIATLAMTWSVQASAQDMFKDVPSDHWAYAAISDLQQKKILLGYPNGYFQGKRVLTRYEFAVALKRALDAIGPGVKGDKGDKGDTGATGAAGDKGDTGATGPPGMTPEQVEALMKLADTFKAELTQLGTDVKAINQRLDALAKSVDAINARLDKMVTLNGEFFSGFRSDLSRNGFIDYGGAIRHASSSPFTAVDSPMDFHLIAHANLAGGVKFVGDIVESNYLNYATLGLSPAGTGGTAHANGGALQTNVYQAELMIPIGQFGSKTVLELGRFKDQITPLTYMRPDTDPYFNLPWYSDGNYIEDGFKLSSKFGSATTQLFAGSYTNLGSNTGAPLNSVFIGNTTSGGAFVGTTANQSAGLHVALPLMKVGELGLTILDFSGLGGVVGEGGGPSFTNEVVYGANFALHPIGRINISAEVAKSVTQADINHTDGNSNDDDNAYNIHASYKSGSLGVLGGYQYIDPRYSAPGFWDKVGSVYNPTNVQGPYARLSYKFTDKLDGSLGGEYLEGARNRPGFTIGSNVGKVETGLKYKLNKTVHLSADYEGDFYNLSAAIAGTRANAWQQFITLGAGVNITGNTVLKFGYQVLANQDKLGITGFTGPNPTNNANTFTTSVAVHF
jgi:hypothetical protein